MHTQKICRVLKFASTYWQEIGEPEHPRVVELRVSKSMHIPTVYPSHPCMQCIIANAWVVVCCTKDIMHAECQPLALLLKHGDVFFVCFSISKSTVSGSHAMQWRTTAIRYKWSCILLRELAMHYAWLHIQLCMTVCMWCTFTTFRHAIGHWLFYLQLPHTLI